MIRTASFTFRATVTATHCPAERDTGIAEHFEINTVLLPDAIFAAVVYQLFEASRRCGVDETKMADVLHDFKYRIDLKDWLDEADILAAEADLLEDYHQTDP